MNDERRFSFFGYVTPYDSALGVELALMQFVGVTIVFKLSLFALVCGFRWDVVIDERGLVVGNAPLPGVQPCDRCHEQKEIPLGVALCSKCRDATDTLRDGPAEL